MKFEQIAIKNFRNFENIEICISYYFQLKMRQIHCRRVILMIVFFERWRIVSQRRFTTFSNVAKTSFRKPCVRSSRQICSIGFISGVQGGMCKIVMFSGTSNLLDLCHAAPSQTTTKISSGNSSCRRFRKSCMHFVLQYGITKKKLSPVIGSTAP